MWRKIARRQMREIHMRKEEIENLIKEAFEAVKNSYAPYSNFNVGAALLSRDGRIFKGCNIENAAYTPTNCAERTAFFKAVSEGVRDFEAICVLGGRDAAKGASITEYCGPCGVCRQVMMEFCSPDFLIILAKSVEAYEVYTLSDLFPQGFGPGNLKK